MTPPKPDPNAAKLPFKPCPFCGNYPEYCLNFSKNLIELACRECNARFALFIEAKYFETNGKDFLSTRWNRRAPPVETPNAVKPIKAYAVFRKGQPRTLKAHDIYSETVGTNWYMSEGDERIEVEIRPISSPSVEENLGEVSVNWADKVVEETIRPYLRENDKLREEIESLRKRLADHQADKARADQLEDLYIAAQKENESLRKKLEVAKENFHRISSCENIEIKRIATTALAQLSDSNELSSNPLQLKIDKTTLELLAEYKKENVELEKEVAKLKDEIANPIEEDWKDACLKMKELNEENSQLQSQVDKLTNENEVAGNDLHILNLNYDKLFDEAEKIRIERDQLRAEQTQLKDAIKEIIENYNSAGMAQSNWNRFQDSLYNASKLLSKSTPPSQEQTPISVMKAMYEALKKTLEHLHPYNTPEVTIDRIVEAMRLYESMGFSQEQSKEVTAEEALEWLSGGKVELIKVNAEKYRVLDHDTEYGSDVLGEGKTPLQAVINAIAKEKESKT